MAVVEGFQDVTWDFVELRVTCAKCRESVYPGDSPAVCGCGLEWDHTLVITAVNTKT